MHKLHLTACVLATFGLSAQFSTSSTAAESIQPIGRGSYAIELPAGAKAPPATIYKTDRVSGPLPTNDWWSSLLWMPLSERQYPHPLAVQATRAGLQIYYPGADITANQAAIFGFMPINTGEDLILGHSAQDEFTEARLDGFSDWFVRAAFTSDSKQMLVSYGHGSPYVYARFEGGSARILIKKPYQIWAGGDGDAVLGITIGGKPYALFGPADSQWEGRGTAELVNRTEGQSYFSLALLPEATGETLTLFREHAYSHVVDTRFDCEYDETTGVVRSTFRYETASYEGENSKTLFALYPHQWLYTSTDLTGHEYRSVRGVMKMGRGSSFETRVAYPGVLPTLPLAKGCDRAKLADLISAEVARDEPAIKDAYWEGKYLGKLASLTPIAEQVGETTAANAFRDQLRQRLEYWLNAADESGQVKDRGLFWYDGNWGALIGHHASFGADVELNDHHFHYGYFLRAAAEIARHDPTWAADNHFGGMLKLLVRDVASTSRDDALFPFLRNFDPYAGHSWAAGHAKFGDGNNNESSSEAMAAWCGVILLGEAIGDKRMRDAGIALFTIESTAVEEYWFDVKGRHHHPDYTPEVVTMVWGGKGANGTWFSGEPEAIHGINWLPIHGGSLYLGRHPDYVERNYASLVEENEGTDWSQWADVIWMYRALFDPQDALRQFDSRANDFSPEAGNSLANAFHWITALREFGRVDRAITANTPLFAVLRRDGVRTYVVYNMKARPHTVTFSDGTTLTAKPNALTVKTSGD
jgi:endoglucanase Acf2